VSIGVGTGKPGTRFEQLVRTSDQALYAAKREGRDRMVSAQGADGACIPE
jgi:PleD family two-component response regulator